MVAGAFDGVDEEVPRLSGIGLWCEGGDDGEDVEVEVCAFVDEAMDVSGDGQHGGWFVLPACCVSQLVFEFGESFARLSYPYPTIIGIGIGIGIGSIAFARCFYAFAFLW